MRIDLFTIVHMHKLRAGRPFVAEAELKFGQESVQPVPFDVAPPGVPNESGTPKSAGCTNFRPHPSLRPDFHATPPPGFGTAALPTPLVDEGPW